MQIIEDTNPIEIIQTMGDEGSSWVVGKDGIMKIVPYHENGQMAEVVWFAVYVDNRIIYRINGAAVEFIDYKRDDSA